MSGSEKLKAIREKLGLKQIDFANALDIPQSHLSDIENGKKEFTLKILNILRKDFNISTDWLLDETSGMENYKTISNPHQMQGVVINTHQALYAKNYNLLLDKKKQLTPDETMKIELVKDKLFSGGELGFIHTIVELKNKLEKLNDYINVYLYEPYVAFDIELCHIIKHKDKDVKDSMATLKGQINVHVKEIKKINNQLYESFQKLQKNDSKKILD